MAMPAPVSAITGVTPPAAIRPAGEAAGPGGFGEVLSAAIGAVEGAGRDASAVVERLLSGESGELHTAVLAAQKAELTFELFLQARNKVAGAYQEIMRMQM
jgi:flagellar hook-basal body complex protein FliE